MSDDTTIRATQGSPSLDRRFVLRVESGPDAGREVVVDDTQPHRSLVGRSPSSELTLSDPLVSRRHFALEIVDGALHVSDLESTNGSTVNAMSIGEVVVRGGEQIRVGSSVIGVYASAATETTPLSNARAFGRMLGSSREMRRLHPLCHKLAEANVPVLIEGETGTGKEVLAESLHEQGPRREGPFVVFDCTTVAPSLLEAELFGHERGAFTGAVDARAGVFEQAHGGTLLIDEIGDLDLALQAKLLRAVERGEVRRVGSARAKNVDVRILSATRRDLDREVQEGRFRDDLYHRLAVARIELPPLRRRRGDISLLVRAFIEQLGGSEAAFTAELIGQWEAYAWPGNVRELRNAVARRLALGDLADMDPPPSSMQSVDSPKTRAAEDAVARVLALGLPLAEARQLVVDEFERRYLEHVLAANGGNVTRAASSSGVARRHFHRLLARTRDGG